MKKLHLACLILVITLVSACAGKHLDMVAEGDVRLVLKESDHIDISKVNVHEHKGRTEIEIVVRPKERVRKLTVGAIKVLETRPDGSEQMLVSERAHVDRHKEGSTMQHAHYFIFIPNVVASGTVLTVSYEP